MTSPLKKVRIQAENLDLDGIQQSLHKVTNKNITWYGHIWKELKESINTLVRSAKEGHWISSKTHVNEKFKSNLPRLADSVAKLSNTMINAETVVKTNEEKQQISHLVKDRVDKVNLLLTRITEEKIDELDEQNLSLILKIHDNLRELSNYCDQKWKKASQLEVPEKKPIESEKAPNLQNYADDLRAKIASLKSWMDNDMNFAEHPMFASEVVKKSYEQLRSEINQLVTKKPNSLIDILNLAENIIDKIKNWDFYKKITIEPLNEKINMLEESMNAEQLSDVEQEKLNELLEAKEANLKKDINKKSIEIKNEIQALNKKIPNLLNDPLVVNQHVYFLKKQIDNTIKDFPQATIQESSRKVLKEIDNFYKEHARIIKSNLLDTYVNRLTRLNNEYEALTRQLKFVEDF